ncbi:MAG: DUF4136 domain-containing protein [Cyclobacteriaceae bacterium]|nr:DUF4136 domain-containing protein [Cyclobacteriaceae bacterium]
MILRIIPAMSFLLVVSCAGYKEMPVEYDYSYKGNFKKYRTFDMIKPAGPYDPTMDNPVIENYIIARMKFLGYRQAEKKPHLLISYKMFPDSLQFTGYIQPEIEEWIKTQDENLNYDKKKLDLKTGTLLIQFFDRRQNRSIWQGYATTLYGPIDYSNNRHLRNAVISILDKYRFWAEGFLEGNVEVRADEDSDN